MSYKHLSKEERYQIDELLRAGLSHAEISKEIGRSSSTLSRELRRNEGARGWRPRQAEYKALERLTVRGKSNARKVNEVSWSYVKEKLMEDQWSPEQLSGRLKIDGLESISHETIYHRILEDKQAGGTLYLHLRCKKKRKKRYGSSVSGRSCIPNRVGIESRPAIVESRKRIGDWEGDTIIGSHTGGAVIASMVERKSRFTVLAKSNDKTTVSVIDAIIDKMEPLSDIVKTTTFDNGKEFSDHDRLSIKLGVSVYFATPYHSWERGLNENTNGLVRQYYPKRTSFDSISEDDLEMIAKKLNNRPRKCLGFKTPNEVIRKLTKNRGVALRI